MLYPTSFEIKLGFDQIRELLRAKCLSSIGKDLVSGIAFSSQRDEIFLNLQLTAEMLQVLKFEEGLPSQDYYDLIPELKRIVTPGTYIEEETLSELRLSLQTVADLIEFFTIRKETCHELYRQIDMAFAGNTCKNRLKSAQYRGSRNMVRLDEPRKTEDGEQTVEVGGRSLSPADELDSKEKGGLIQEAINSLPADQKSVVVLRDVEGLSYEEISEATGYNLGTVKSKLARARQELREKLKGLV